jgi:hypothetical protein
MRYAGPSTRRAFGLDSKEHEIFWVTDKKEWRQKVGSGENGTLGVTVSPYQCASGGRSSREIYDADLIMNGAGKFKWSLSCKDAEGDCESVRSTLTHELGHFIGLGHPCTLCSTSIMSAQAGYDLEYPVLDDFQAARVLYPGQLLGQMGTRCDKEADCESNLSCITQNNTKYCSQSCKDSCPNGYECNLIDQERFCQFSNGRLAGTVGLHERCETRVCDEGLQCIETFTEKSLCVKNCVQKSDCPSSEECVLFDDGGGGVCLKSVGLDQVCNEFTTCAGKMICVGKNESEGFCKYECHEGRRGQCRTGGVCTSVGQDLSACMDAKVVASLVVSVNEQVEATGAEALGSAKSGCSCMSVPSSPAGPLSAFIAVIIRAVFAFMTRGFLA